MEETLQRFHNRGALRGHAKEILNWCGDSEQMKTEGSDFELMKALPEYHPKGKEKSKDMSGITIHTRPKGESRCSASRC